MRRHHFGIVIVGGGPAGLAPLVAAAREGRLETLLARGVAVVEAGPTIGGGRLGRYVINSDSTAETFLTAVRNHRDPCLMPLAELPLCRAMAALGRGSVPLAEAGRFALAIGATLGAAIEQAGGAVLTGHEALGLHRRGDAGWTVALRRTSEGASLAITADAVLLSTGGSQTRAQLRDEPVAGDPLLPRYADTLMLSEDMLQPAGLAAVHQRLAQRSRPKVAIVGGSTSALAVAGLLLRTGGDALGAPGGITVLHRRPLRVFYPSAAAALADGYDDFGPADICPVSGFVYRLAGMRLDSRDLVMQLLGVGGAAPEPRVCLHRLASGEDAAAHRILAEADVVIAALGYRPRALPVFDRDGQTVALRGVARRGRLVDALCRVCDVGDRPVPGVYGIGLAAGFLPSGRLGGEPSFNGQANGLWLWQNDVGALAVDGLLAHAPAAEAPGPAEKPVAEMEPPLCPALAFA